MKRVAWVTDIHLNFVHPGVFDGFCRAVRAANPNLVLVGGDIGEAPTVEEYLGMLQDELQRPIYLVLGNHDFYRGSISEVRAAVKRRCARSAWLRWLPQEGAVEITAETGLVGHDSWADGRLGAGPRSSVMLNDYVFIRELAGLSTEERFRRLNGFGDEAAKYVREVLSRALDRYRRVVMLTHVPPFREAAWHNGGICDDDHLPHFACQTVGEVLREVMQARPDRELEVLCGHTHGSGFTQVLPNLSVRTGGATYGQPEVQEILTGS